MDLGAQGPKGPTGGPRGPWGGPKGSLGPPQGTQGAQGAPWGPWAPLLGGAREGSFPRASRVSLWTQHILAWVPKSPKIKKSTKWVAVAPFGTLKPGSGSEFRPGSRRGVPGPESQLFDAPFWTPKCPKVDFLAGFLIYPRPIAMDLGPPRGPRGPQGGPWGPKGPLGGPKGPLGPPPRGLGAPGLPAGGFPVD